MAGVVAGGGAGGGGSVGHPGYPWQETSQLRGCRQVSGATSHNLGSGLLHTLKGPALSTALRVDPASELQKSQTNTLESLRKNTPI